MVAVAITFVVRLRGLAWVWFQRPEQRMPVMIIVAS